MPKGLLACLCLSVTLVSAVSAQTPRRVRMKLARDTVASGIHCGASQRIPAAFYEAGGLASCPLASDTVLFGHELPAGTWVSLTPAGQPASAWLPRDTKLQGSLCRGTGHGGWAVVFYTTGALRTCFLARDEVVQGVPCLKGSFWNEIVGGVYVTFYANGRLQTCAVSRHFTLGDMSYQKRARIWLDETGHPVVAPHRQQ